MNLKQSLISHETAVSLCPQLQDRTKRCFTENKPMFLKPRPLCPCLFIPLSIDHKYQEINCTWGMLKYSVVIVFCSNKLCLTQGSGKGWTIIISFNIRINMLVVVRELEMVVDVTSVRTFKKQEIKNSTKNIFSLLLLLQEFSLLIWGKGIENIRVQEPS